MEANETTIPNQLKKLSEEKPDKEAFIFLDKHFNKTVLTRKDVWDKSQKFAAVLCRNGIKKGDIVCNNLLNTPERIITDFGIIFSGASPLHGQFILQTGDDLVRNLKTAECKGIIMDPKQRGGAAPIIEALKYTDENTGEIKYKHLPHLKLVLNVDVFVDHDVSAEEAASRHRFLTSLDNENDMYVDQTITGNDRAWILITSGTSGFSKLVCHLHRTMLAMGRVMGDTLDICEESVYYNDRSFGWVGGLPFMFMAKGATRAATDLSCGVAEDTTAHILRVISKVKCDATILLSFEISKILQRLNDGYELDRKIPMVITGGGPLPPCVLNVLGRLGDTLAIVYASSECGTLSCLKVKDQSQYEDNCVGHAVKGVTFKAVDEKLNPVPFNELGEILIQTPTLAACYLNNPDQTKESFLADGWFRPGDIGRVERDGRTFMYCRKSNAILKSGIIIYPGWIEAHVNKCPGVTKSVVVGIPDPRTYNEIALCVIPATDFAIKEEDVLEFCKRTFVTSDSTASLVPKQVIFVDTIPINANGKVDRKILKTDVCKRLGITSGV